MSEIKPFEFTLMLGPEPENKRTFASTQDLQAFVAKEAQHWGRYAGLEVLRRHFAGMLEHVNAAAVSTNAENRDHHLRILSRLNSNSHGVFSETAMGKFLSSLAREDARMADAAYTFLITQERVDMDSARVAEGVFRAFLFKAASTSDYVGIARAEKESLGHIRGELNSLRDSITKEFLELKESMATWATGERARVEKWLGDAQEQAAKAIRESGDALQRTQQEWKEAITEMEVIYREKLRLEAPAQYWEQVDNQYVKRGRSWLGASVAASVVLITWLTMVTYKPPQALLDADGMSYPALKATILLAIATSTALYLIKTFIQLCRSSYHLARDARERRQLTHVYLALKKDTEVSADDRRIILQALFSRADTGLLHGDSAPTMPGVDIMNIGRK